MRKILLSLTALMLSASAFAQGNIIKAQAGMLQRNPEASVSNQHKVNKAPRKINLADNQLILGGYTSDTYTTNGVGLPNKPGTYPVALRLPVNDFLPFDGGKVVKIRFALAQATPVTRVFITPVSGGNIGNDLVSQNVRANAAGWTEVTLKTPLDLDFSAYDELLIGFDYNQASGAYPLSIVEEGNTYYDAMVYGNLGNGTAWYNIGHDYGNLSVQAIVEGEFVGNSARPVNMGNVLVPLGRETTKYLSVVNTGKGKLQSLDYVLSIDGVDQPEQHATLYGAGFGETDYAPVTFTSAATEITQQYTLTVTKVNGEPNNETTNSVSGLVASTTKEFVHRVAVEEFTGTGCGYCPRGIVGMEMLRNTYNDLFVGIALHQYNSGDPMFIPYASYAYIDFEGAPECTVQRQGFTDPYYGNSDQNFGISSLFESVAAQPVFANVELEAQWNSDSTKVDVKADVESVFDGVDYNLEFVLVGDSLTGTTTAWRQANYYYQYTEAQVGSPDLAPWCKNGTNGKANVSGLKFNDVALASSYVSDENEVAPIKNISSAEGATREYTLSLPTNATLKNAIKPHLVFAIALLIDPADGSIVNAAKVPVAGYGSSETTGIASVTKNDSGITTRYALDGRQLSTPQKGINIIRQADGTTRKVFVR